MEWLEDARAARDGDLAARARLEEYLAPFVHGVLLAHAAHHLVSRELPRVLGEVLASVPTVAPQHLGALALHTAREHGERLALSREPEQPAPRQDVTVARQVLARLRVLMASTRERLVLRLVEGIPGPEQAGLSGEAEAEVKGDLERGAAEALRLLGITPGGLPWLWSFEGEPSPPLARLETQLAALRFEPGGDSHETLDGATNATWHDLSFSQGQALPTGAPQSAEAVERTHVAGPPTGASAPELTAAEVAGPTLQVIDVPVAARPAREVTSPGTPSEPTLVPLPDAARPDLEGWAEPGAPDRAVRAESKTGQHAPEPRAVVRPRLRAGSPDEGLAEPDRSLAPPGRAAPRRAVTEQEVRTAPTPRAPRWPLVLGGVGLVAAVGLGGLAAYWLRQHTRAAPTVLVAARDLEAGHVLVAADFASAPLRASPTPPEALAPADAAALLGTVLSIPLERGAALLAPLATASPPPRRRAVRLLAPPGLELRSGDRVDVRVTRPGAPPLAGLVARGVPVVQVTEGGTSKHRAAPTLALLLDASHADSVELALRLGRLDLLPGSASDGPDAEGARLLAEADAREHARRRARAR